MCTFHGELIGRQLNEFIVKNIGYMDTHCISQQVSDLLLLQDPAAVAAGKDDVYAHINWHMLHPRVRMAVMLRQMLEFAGLLQGSMVVRDGDNCTVDRGNAELYLKVIAQVMTLYKADPQGMQFGEDIGGAAPPQLSSGGGESSSSGGDPHSRA